jgi:hypothetical protein
MQRGIQIGDGEALTASHRMYLKPLSDNEDACEKEASGALCNCL